MVMGWIWTGMVLLALGAAVLTGQTGALTAAALELSLIHIDAADE